MKKQVLDHGYIEFVEHWGSDERVIEAARMSTDKGFQGWGPKYVCDKCGLEGVNGLETCIHDVCCFGKVKEVPGDEKLLAYLYNNVPKHTSPFEMGGAIFEVQAPIMVFREWYRHRTQSFSEMSGRYTPLPDVNYIPSIERLMIGSDGKNKQSGTIKGAEVLTGDNADWFRDSLRDMWDRQEDLYQDALKMGVPKELARVHIGVGRYSRMRASANLLNWIKFLILRMDSKAQWEIRQYANEVAVTLRELFPRTMDLFDKERYKSNRPRKVCLCGSTRFKDQYLEAQKREGFAGKIVTTVVVFGHLEGLDMEGEVKKNLDKLHLAKIDDADEILVIDVGGYIGESTKREIEYCTKLGKPVRYWSKENV